MTNISWHIQSNNYFSVLLLEKKPNSYDTLFVTLLLCNIRICTIIYYEELFSKMVTNNGNDSLFLVGNDHVRTCITLNDG
jgi:hypothetical protein